MAPTATALARISPRRGTTYASSKSTAEIASIAVPGTSASSTRSASSARGCESDPGDVDALLLEARQLAAQGVELALGRHDAGRMLAAWEARQESIDELVRALAEGDGVARGRSPCGRARLRPTARALGKTASSHLSSTKRAASSNDAVSASRATSGHAWCECPVSSTRPLGPLGRKREYAARSAGRSSTRSSTGAMR